MELNDDRVQLGKEDYVPTWEAIADRELLILQRCAFRCGRDLAIEHPWNMWVFMVDLPTHERVDVIKCYAAGIERRCGAA